MAETVHINMNDTVEVTLTAKGLAVFRAYEHCQASVCASTRLTTEHRYLPDQVWSGSMWEAFEIFGAHTGMGKPVTFDKNELRVPQSAEVERLRALIKRMQARERRKTMRGRRR